MVRFIIMSVMLAIPLSAQPKSTAELVLECGEYTQLARTGLPVGVDQYLIASCFAYIEAFLDLAVTGPEALKRCVPPELELGILATQVAGITDDDRRPSSAALALEAVLAEVLACP
jgi:hypothetical protein